MWLTWIGKMTNPSVAIKTYGGGLVDPILPPATKEDLEANEPPHVRSGEGSVKPSKCIRRAKARTWENT